MTVTTSYRTFIVSLFFIFFASFLSGHTLDNNKPYILLLSQSKEDQTGFGGSISSDGLNFTTWQETSSGYVKFLWSQKNLNDPEPLIKEKRNIPEKYKVPNDSNHCRYSLGENDVSSQAFYFDMLSAKGTSIFNKELTKKHKIGRSCISFCDEASTSFSGVWWDSENFNGHTYIYQAEKGLNTLRPDTNNPDGNTNIYDMSGDGKIVLLKVESTDSFYAYFKDKGKYQKLSEVESGHISPNGKYICAISVKENSKFLTKWILKGEVYELEKSFSDKYDSVEDTEPSLSSLFISDNGDIATDLITTQGDRPLLLLNNMEAPCLVDSYLKSLNSLQWDARLPIKNIKTGIVRGVFSDDNGIMVLLDIVDNNKSYPVKIFYPRLPNTK